MKESCGNLTEGFIMISCGIRYLAVQLHRGLVIAVIPRTNRAPYLRKFCNPSI